MSAVTVAPEGWPEWPERTIVGPVVDWCYDNLLQPDGPNAGNPWEFTDEQLRILAYWLAFDENDRWLYRRGTIRLCKGAGKDPLGAVLAAVELCGPSRVRNGKAIRYLSPWVQVAAVSRDQTRTTMRIFPQLFAKHTVTKHAIEVNKEIIYANGGAGVIEAVTSSPDSLEGGRATLTIRNETQYWRKGNGGHDMAEVIDGNLAKSRDGAARALSLCNAHVPGEDTVGEREWDAFQAIQAGRTRLKDVFYYSVEAPPGTKLDDEISLKAGLRAAAGDASWLDIDRLAAEIWDPRTTPSEARRKYLNQIVAAEDAWLAPFQWGACAVPGTKLELEEEITLGFDGSKSDDHTALIACRISDGALFTLGVWDPERSGGEVPRQAVDAEVARAFQLYDVVGFYSDLHPFESYVDAWADEFGPGLCALASIKHPIAFDMRSRQQAFTNGAERFHDAVIEGVLKHDGDARLAEHVANARRRPNRHGLSFGKETRESKRKVDALAAAVLARIAYHDYLALPPGKRRRKRTGKAMFI